MTAGGRRRGRRGPRRWGETAAYLPPSPGPEGIDLVIQKMQIDDDVIRRNRQIQMEEREAQSDAADLADGIAALTRPERDHLGRVVVDWRYALVGALVVAIVAALGFWVAVTILNTPAANL